MAHEKRQHSGTQLKGDWGAWHSKLDNITSTGGRGGALSYLPLSYTDANQSQAGPDARPSDSGGSDSALARPAPCSDHCASPRMYLNVLACSLKNSLPEVEASHDEHDKYISALRCGAFTLTASASLHAHDLANTFLCSINELLLYSSKDTRKPSACTSTCKPWCCYI